MSNYYDILGLSKEATADDIKKAYRKQAMQHNPDKGGDEATSKQIQEAYDILSDENKRSQYDRYGSATGNNSPFGSDMFNFGDFFSGFGSPFSRVRKAQDIKVGLELTLHEIVFGVTKKIKYHRMFATLVGVQVLKV